MRATRHAGPLTLLLAMLALLAAGAQVAGAATICVQDPSCPAGSETQPTIAAALTAAGNGGHPGLDRILLGATTFTEGALTASAGNPVDLVGAGAGQTTIAPVAGNGVTTLTLADPASTVSDLTVQLAAGTGEIGLALAGTARRVTVSAANGTTGTGVSLALGAGGTFLNGTVALPTTGSVTGVSGTSNGGVADSSITAHQGVLNVAVVQRARVTGVFGIVASPSFLGGVPVTTTVDDTLVQLVGTNGVALLASGLGFSSFLPATLIARHVTAIGNGGGSIGVESTSSAIDPGTETVTVTVSNTILTNFATDLSRTASTGGTNANAVAQLTIGHSDFDPFKRVDTNTSGGGGGGGTASGSITDAGGNLTADPRFRTAFAPGDFGLLADSPLIDRGDPEPALGEPSTDLVGNPRVVDGNGDGVAVTDIGAYEFVPAPPGGGGGPPPPAHVALGRLSLTHARFAVGAGATARSAAQRRRARVPRGTTIRFTLSRAATVTLVVEQRAAGRRSGGRCVRPSRRLAHAKRCTRVVKLFTFTRHGRQGANAIAFSGRVGRRGRTALAPGSYQLLATATADRFTTPGRSTRFAIVRG